MSVNDNINVSPATYIMLAGDVDGMISALEKAREFVRIFTPREDHLGDKAKDVAIAIDAAMDKARGEQ